MYVLPQGPQKFFTLYAPNEDYFCQYGNEPTKTKTARRELRVPPLFVPEQYMSMFGALEDPGYRGLFLFDQRHLDFYFQYGGVWNGTQFPVYSHFMALDLDKTLDVDVPWLQYALRDYDYLLYSSGTSGNYHLIIPHNLISSMNFRLLYESFLSLSFVRVDSSIWYPTGLLSLPGNRHPDTRERKTLVHANSGKMLWFEDNSIDEMLRQSRIIFDRSFFEKFKRGEG